MFVFAFICVITAYCTLYSVCNSDASDVFAKITYLFTYLRPPVTAKQRVVKFQEMSLSNGQMATDGKTEKMRALKRE